MATEDFSLERLNVINDYWPDTIIRDPRLAEETARKKLHYWLLYYILCKWLSFVISNLLLTSTFGRLHCYYYLLAKMYSQVRRNEDQWICPEKTIQNFSAISSQFNNQIRKCPIHDTPPNRILSWSGGGKYVLKMWWKSMHGFGLWNTTKFKTQNCEKVLQGNSCDWILPKTKRSTP